MISIVVPLYNKESTVHSSLDSIISQSYQDWECIVVDDSSTDNSCEIVRNYKDSRIKLFTKPNGGPSSSRNYGVKKTSGEWVLFLDADDQFLPDALQIFSQYIERYPKAKVITSNFFIERNGNRGLYSMSAFEGKSINPFVDLCFRSLFIRTGNTIFHKDIAETYPFNEKYRRYEDLECFFSIMRNEAIYSIKRPTMIYNCNFSEASKSTPNKSIDYMYNINFKNPSQSFWEKVYLYGLLTKDMTKEGIDLYKLYPEFEYNISIHFAIVVSKVIVKIKMFIFRLLGKQIMLY